ncbi:class I SAM-dependent methyltransferase [Leuconostoc gelidum subsp. aenigmaticum]|uniref:class I SAM-dependent methyltransferase n=1 Tax=Leuconostoc gelidum TaxID=1244 RepID=UPI001CC73DF8|nr:class I SAM-dependent methyltransferase [Leuconostoc gelidum]MBZ6003700.1 class I SAM-dependent methyltransferase [Leuconostoc gelidum subsp. aenigmaticum]
MIENMFKNNKIADQFNRYNDVLEQVLGYDKIFSFFSGKSIDTILDYGCGPGKVSFRLAQQTNAHILAVDESQKMINLAKTERSHKNVVYDIVENDNLKDVQENTIGGAIACYVFINNHSESRIQHIMAEIYRVLQPGSCFIILDTNPNTTGIPFSTFQNGVTGKHYGYGEPRVETLHVSQDENLILHDFNWPNRMYEDNLKKSGFLNIQVTYPMLSDFTTEQLEEIKKTYHYNRWTNEKTKSPFIMYQAIK